MTTAAGVRYVAVIKACAQPGVGVMACITFSSSLDMCWMLSCGSNTVMTTAAGVRYVAVIKTDIAPGDSVMAGIALIIGNNMCRVHTGSSNAVMTGVTGTNDSVMVDTTNTIEGDGVVAILASRSR